jgi:hypothetical protein
MNFSFQASSRTSSDWMLLKMLRDPSKKWRVDVYGQASGEQEWRPLFSKTVGLPDDRADTGNAPPADAGTAPLPLVDLRVIPDVSAGLLERVQGRWL